MELNANSNVNELWTEFKNEHKKTYAGTEEENNRFKIFVENIEKIIAHNEKHAKGEVTYKMGLNKFADMTNDERNEMCGHGKK